jgi:hypothetical protein
MSVSEQFRWSWEKQAVPGDVFIASKDFEKREFKNWACVGHNRAATSGGIKTDNAHPFKQGDIILVHNGTLRSVYNFDHKGNFDVDSELLAYNLSREEPADAHKVLTNVQGAYALVWFDTRDETINIARNSERPFHFGLNKAEDLLVFASDGFLLNFLTQRMHDPAARPANIWELGTGIHLKYKKGDMVPEVTKIAPFTYAGWSRPDATTSRRTTHMGWVSDSTTTPRGTSGSTSAIIRPAGAMCSLGKAKINGDVQSIPAVYTEMLENWYGLRHDDSLFFEARKFIPWGTGGMGCIVGQIYHPGWDCWFDAYMEATPSIIGLYGGQPWTVHAAAVSHASFQEKGVVMFQVKPVTYMWDGDNSAYENLATEANNEVELQERRDAMENEAIYYGPHGPIDEQGFKALVADGCVMCGANIFPNDHEDLTWVGEMANQPLCYTCLDYSTTEINKAAENVKD